MKNIVTSYLLFLVVVTLTSCEVIGGIFKAGIWVGVIGVLVVVGLVLWLIAKIRK